MKAGGFSRPRPSVALSVAIFVCTTALMVYLRLYLYGDRPVTLTYGLPLLICLWYRDRRLLWAMAVTFVAMAGYKHFVLVPNANPNDYWELEQWLMQVINMVVIAGAVHAILNVADRLAGTNRDLEVANKELAARSEEITRQNEELQAQSEELAEQNEEIQSQTEALAQQNQELHEKSEELTLQAGELQQANEELQQREEMLETLLASARGNPDPPALLERICQSTLRLLGDAVHAAAVVEREGNELVVRAHAGIPELESGRWLFQNSFASIVMGENRTAFVEDITLRPELVLTKSKTYGFRSLLATPLRLRGEPAGAVEVYSRSPRSWTKQELLIVEWVAAEASLILEAQRLAADRRRAETNLRRQNQRLKLLSEALRHLLVARTDQNVATDLFPLVANELGADVYLNFLVDETGEKLRLNCWAGIPDEAAAHLRHLEFGQAICGEVAQTRQPIVAERIQETGDPRADLVRGFGIRSYACHPLVSGGRLIGTLSFASRKRDEFAEDDMEFLQTISQYVSIAMDRLRTEKELQAANARLESEVERRTARLREAINELEHFSYTITHDMRAPLRAMQGLGEILLDESKDRLDPAQQGYLRKIVKAAERMDALIRDALSYSKVVRDQMPLTAVDSGLLLADIVQSYPALQPPSAIVEIEGELPWVLGNEAGLTQCFSNLLDNAVKFVRTGETPRVRVRADSHNGMVRLWFEDNGIGIKAEHQGQLFKMFHRLNHDYDGTGIGLALVRKVAERMGGQVGVESEYGRGSRFWLELQPVEEEEP